MASFGSQNNYTWACLLLNEQKVGQHFHNSQKLILASLAKQEKNTLNCETNNCINMIKFKHQPWIKYANYCKIISYHLISLQMASKLPNITKINCKVNMSSFSNVPFRQEIFQSHKGSPDLCSIFLVLSHMFGFLEQKLLPKKFDLRKTKLFRDRPSSFCSTYPNICDRTKKMDNSGWIILLEICECMVQKPYWFQQ
jgi:hypothetical protein